MSVSIDIHPLSHTLDMYGDPDISSAYSLSGYISISLASSSSLFGGSLHRTVRLLLQSLAITFEGQSEVITHQIGYAPLRLCSLTRDLAPSEPIELTNEGQEDSDKPCTWNVSFNLIIPGWLPATAAFGDSFEDAGTRYALFSTAKFVALDDNSDKTWSLSTLCSMFGPKTRTVHAQKCAVALRRFMNRPSVPSSTTSLFHMSNYVVHAKPERTDGNQDLPSIPLDILSKIQVVASVPEYISTDEDSVPVAIRLRTADLEDAECKRLRVTSFVIDVRQAEKYRGLPFSDYAACYPIPSSSEQPPNKPLLDPHPFHTLYDTGLVTGCVRPDQTVARSFSVTRCRDYPLTGDGYMFANDYTNRETSTWYKISTSVPLAESSSRPRELRVSGDSPLFVVRHEMHVTLTCAYDFPETPEPVTERLHFSAPLHFVHITPTPLSRSTSPSPSLGTSDSSSLLSLTEPVPQDEMITCDLPYSHSLPAYSQLFDSNGDRQIDHSIPLPLYTRHPPLADHLELDAGGGAGKSVFFIANGSSI